MKSADMTHAAFDWPYSRVRIRTFTFRNCNYEILDAIRIQRRISSSFAVKMLSINLPKFTSKEKSGAYSVYSYSRIASTERALGLCLLDICALVIQPRRNFSEPFCFVFCFLFNVYRLLRSPSSPVGNQGTSGKETKCCQVCVCLCSYIYFINSWVKVGEDLTEPCSSPRGGEQGFS